jgi:hypothetical protein
MQFPLGQYKNSRFLLNDESDAWLACRSGFPLNGVSAGLSDN